MKPGAGKESARDRAGRALYEAGVARRMNVGPPWGELEQVVRDAWRDYADVAIGAVAASPDERVRLKDLLFALGYTVRLESDAPRGTVTFWTGADLDRPVAASLPADEPKGDAAREDFLRRCEGKFAEVYNPRSANEWFEGGAVAASPDEDGMVRVLIDNVGYRVRADVPGQYLLSLRPLPRGRLQEWEVWMEIPGGEDKDAGWDRPLNLTGGERFYTMPKYITASAPAAASGEGARERVERVRSDDVRAGDRVWRDDEWQVVSWIAWTDREGGYFSLSLDAENGRHWAGSWVSGVSVLRAVPGREPWTGRSLFEFFEHEAERGRGWPRLSNLGKVHWESLAERIESEIAGGGPSA